MYQTKNGLVTVTPIADITDAIFPQADFSIVGIPGDADKALKVLENLYNSPSQAHIALAVPKGKTKDKITGLGSISKSSFEYFDTVTLWYEKGMSSGGKLTSVSEPAYLLFKGPNIDVDKTKWFGVEENASNLWNVSGQEGEPRTHTGYGRFSWEVAMLLMGMAGPLKHGKFIYALPGDKDIESISLFCEKYGLTCQMYASSDEKAKRMVS